MIFTLSIIARLITQYAPTPLKISQNDADQRLYFERYYLIHVLDTVHKHQTKTIIGATANSQIQLQSQPQAYNYKINLLFQHRPRRAAFVSKS